MRRGWTALVGAAALLAACTPQHPAKTVTVYTPPATGGTHASVTPAVTASPTPAGTEQNTISLFQFGALKPGYTVRDVAPGMPECYGPSEGGSGPNTFMCGATADGTNACVQSQLDSDAPETMYCLTTPWAKELLRFTATKIVATDESPDKRPMGVELADGSRWRMVTGGAWSPPDGYGVAYSCVDGCVGYETLVARMDPQERSIDTSTARWTALRAKDQTDAPPPVRVDVAKAWFLQGAKDFRQPKQPPAVRRFNPGFKIETVADVDSMGNQVSESFKTFMRAQMRQQEAKGACHNAYAVSAWRDDGFASGGASASSGCGPVAGGAAIFWAQPGGVWKEVIATQSIVKCSVWRDVKYPSEMAGKECYDGTQVVAYNQP